MDDMRRDYESRFVLNDGDSDIISIPQCVDCVHNKGMLECAALASKPMQYVMNTEECPMYEKEQ
ncbi:MAG: hypothetical protein K6F00_00710 [Lachnospiraceae bacterium]|nr:hypothetical protein [Lachnospiraceae bacterium]